MGGERSMGGKGAHLGDLGWPAGRGSSRRRAGQRRQVDDEQDRRLLDEQGSDSGTSRGGAEEEHDQREEQGRSRGAGPAGRRSCCGWVSWLGLPSNPLAAGSGGRAGIPPALRFGAPKLAALELALISRAYAPRPRPPTRRLAPPPRRLAPRCATMPLVMATGFAQLLGTRSRRVVAA